MGEEETYKQKFVVYSSLNILRIFIALPLVALIFFLNVSILFPHLLPSRHTFVLDSAEFIDEIYYFGSGPQEIDEGHLDEDWLDVETIST